MTTKDETLTDPRLLWVDVESTGLTDGFEPGSLRNGGLLLEVCLLLTTPELVYLDHRSFVIRHSPDLIAGMRQGIPQIVRAMHDDNGLWDDSAWSDVTGTGGTRSQVEHWLTTWLTQWDVKPRTLPMCGSSVHTDRQWLAEHLPDVEDWFHYRNIDVSSVKELAKRWYAGGRRPTQEPRGQHRAYPDLLDTLDELRHYQSAVFQPASVPVDVP